MLFLKNELKKVASLIKRVATYLSHTNQTIIFWHRASVIRSLQFLLHNV